MELISDKKNEIITEATLLNLKKLVFLNTNAQINPFDTAF